MERSIRLYTSQSLQCGKTIQLEKQAAHHLLKVLRSKIGTKLLLFNNTGFDFSATLTDTSEKKPTVSIDTQLEVRNESPLNITLLQGISRGDRVETTLQKSVELGVNVVIPVMCSRSNYAIKKEREEKKMAHWKQVIISACEQSGRATVPQLCDIQDFSLAVKSRNDGHKILLSPDANRSIKDSISPGNDISVLIGPEGGLTQQEITLATEHGYEGIKFGPRILRTETAGPAVISALQTLWGDY